MGFCLADQYQHRNTVKLVAVACERLVSVPGGSICFWHVGFMCVHEALVTNHQQAFSHRAQPSYVGHSNSQGICPIKQSEGYSAPLRRQPAGRGFGFEIDCLAECIPFPVSTCGFTYLVFGWPAPTSQFLTARQRNNTFFLQHSPQNARRQFREAVSLLDAFSMA